MQIRSVVCKVKLEAYVAILGDIVIYRLAYHFGFIAHAISSVM